ncbi:uncharacterized protein LOC112525800 isoform X2 [Cynara cardunculus var. scolymus]|uniref:uncharacterized protein LOC112525800 isoform X2 n=1 Tax=Cynara cardunculus var. scolymus TaxID=59895 RepID=UPI000D6264F8|nr:uncharacterized protein LOC112525800 isoform X2 [Cynara cardunculus var. scolymus]
MEPLGLVVDKLKGFAKSTQDLTNSFLHSFGFSSRRHPIEILKRLQREAFSDIMKLRDRQDKVERILSFKASKGSPFDENGTRIRGQIELLGLLLMIDRIHEENQDAIRRTGIKTGISSRFTFETTVRQKDSLIAEFVASDKGQLDALDSPLSLAKVLYAANINDWCSLIAVPVGGRCSDVGPSRTSHQEHTNLSFSQPPLLNQHIGTTHCLSTFGQLVYQLSKSSKLSLLGLHQIPKISSQHISLGPLFLPIGMFGRHAAPMEPFAAASGSTALVLESELDSSTRIGGWIEMNNSDSRNLQWAVSMSDLPEDDFGWGLRVCGSVSNWYHYEVEAISKMKFGEKLSLEPSLVFVIDGSAQFPALMLKSSWSF